MFGLAVDQRGDLFIADTPNQIIRELQPPLTGAAAGSCTMAAATQLVERQHLGGFTGFRPHPVAKVLCGPFLGRRTHAMIVALITEICTPAGGWVVYRKRGQTWHRVLYNPIGAVLRRGRTRFTQNIADPRPSETLCTTRRWLRRKIGRAHV